MLKHLKIRTKIISVVALLGLITMAGLIYVISEFRRADAAYSAFIDHEAQASMLSARASASAVASVLQGNPDCRHEARYAGIPDGARYAEQAAAGA